MPEAKDWITYALTIVSIAVTAWFSYRVLKATEATNEVTRATLELSKQISRAEEERQKEFIEKMRKQLIPEIIKQSKAAHDATVDTNASKINLKLKTAPTELLVTNEDLATYFKQEEINVIRDFWNTYSSYRKKYYKKFYPDNDMGALLEHAAPVAEKYANLINTIKH
ncbi:hypothetical protein [Priestia megaterium]|uniref:hypothetical protein n=1 Tax=Priestia megaterium TaxID=1404 RepID=UPI00221F7877|nr:hypothetical protein OHU75_14535 [Priestia megaterium]